MKLQRTALAFLVSTLFLLQTRAPGQPAHASPGQPRRHGQAAHAQRFDGRQAVSLGQPQLDIQPAAKRVGRRLAAELHRVMKPGALAVFHEPFGNSLLLERLRRLVPVPSGSPDDPDQWKHQFKYADLEPFRGHFSVAHTEFQVLSRLERIFPGSRVRNALGRMDRALLSSVPVLRRYARAIVIELRKPNLS